MKRRKNRPYKKLDLAVGPEPVILRPLEVKIEECGGNTTKMIRRFNKKVRREEVLKPYYDRLMFFKSKSQKRRDAKLKAIYKHKKEKREEEQRELRNQEAYDVDF